MRWSELTQSALVSGSCASVASTAVSALPARAEGTGPWRPIDAASHWRNGGKAPARRGIDWAHTGIGYTACIFWGLLHETWCARCGPTWPALMLRDAALMAAIAAAVDYGPTPRRFTPDWDLVLSKTGMALAYAGLALGLVAGASRSQLRLPR